MAPHAALIEEYPAQSRTGAHFHPVDQFQVFFGAAGSWYQRHPIGDLLLHYTDAYTTYGPFGAGDEPMSFFTLRARRSDLTGYMPEARDKLVHRGRRNIHRDLSHLLGHPVDPGATDSTVVIAPDDDGLAAHLVACGPSARVELPPPAGAGRYYCVVGGQVNVGDGGRRFGRRSLGWSAGTGAAPLLTTPSTAGAEVLVVQFPMGVEERDHVERRDISCS